MKAHPFLNSFAFKYKSLSIGLMVFILFTALAQFASFSLIQQHLISFYGVEPEDISMSVLAMYAGIITFLPIQFRLLRYFPVQKYFITAIFIGILLNIASFITHDIAVFIVLRFLHGLAVAVCVGGMLYIILSTLPGEKGALIGSSFLFTAILTTAVIIGILSSWVAVNMNWNFTYYGLIALQILAILVALLIFQPKMILRSFPLYQLDWTGAFFFANFSLSLAYLMIYGPRQYWFSSHSIRLVSLYCFVMLLFYLYRQATLKRPLIDLRAFKYGKFILGLFLLLIFYGIKDTINLIYGYAGGILGWSAEDVVYLGLYNSAGVIIAIWISVKLILKNKLFVPKLIISGFLLMIVYNLWMYFSLTPNMSFTDLAVPVFMQGIAVGFVFLPVMIFTMSAIPKFTGFTSIIVCAYARFIATLNSISGFYTLQLHYNQEYKEGFLEYLTTDNQNFVQRSSSYQSLFLLKGYTADQANALSNVLISKATAIQGQLLTNRTIFMIGALLMVLAIVVLLTFIIISKIMASKNQRQLAV
ncbi:MFS transporter, DHA2 family, multidrug resistance protein [Flavobacterium resistens]|uniref:MFS transporter n=1 Tax=Flavobacterium resistens TaxID=443612 RepID=A0A521AUY5_9FLAO|nr:MFS transporter [Flavobacterium resistens]MRX68579.1 MFS transporter [Flavobacterium resistens]SMO38390.1 MFS transporter, DHA2 family, multidrug resistance protein [Flavobacterium resistens]